MVDDSPAAAAVPILVVSCDAYADVWRPFFQIFRQRWPDCPFPLHLGSNGRVFDDDGVTTIPVGHDRSWASSVVAMLDALGSAHVLLLLEDFLLTAPVDTEHVRRLVGLGLGQGVGCLRLTASRAPFRIAIEPLPGLPGLGAVPAGEPYRVSTQAALWRTDTLRRLLVPGFSAWDFELVGSDLSGHLEEPFWEVERSVLHYEHGVERGRWRPRGLEICREAGVPVDLHARPAFTADEYAAHLARCSQLLARYHKRQELVSLLRGGRRLRGLRRALQAIAEEPTAIGVWATLVAGLAGASGLDWLDRRRLQRNLQRAGARYARSAAPEVA